MIRSKRLKICSLFMALVMVVSMMLIPIKAETEVLTLIGDRSDALTINAGETKVLNLGGFTMTGKIVNNGTLTINGEGNIAVTGDHVITNSGILIVNGGTFDALTDGKGVIYNNLGANVTITGGKFLRSKEAGYKADGKSYSGGNSWYTILNHGIMSISGGFFENSGDYSSLLDNGWYSSAPSGGTQSQLKISGGTFTSGMHTIKNDSYGNLEITKGTFTSTESGSAILNWNDAKISGGTFTSEKNHAVYAAGTSTDLVESGKLSVSGGEFNSATAPAFAVDQTYPGFITVTGGSYNKDLGVTVPNEYKIVNEAGRNVVKAKEPKITLSATMIAIPAGSTETLVATLSEALEAAATFTSMNENVATIDANGVITAKDVGTTKITVSTRNATDVTCNVTVYKTAAPTLPNPEENTGKNTTIAVDKKSSQVLASTLDNVLANLDAALNTGGISEETKQALSEAIASGKTITISAQTKKVNKENVKKDAKKVEEFISKQSKVAQYFDLSMDIQADGNKIGTLDTLNAKATFTITVPKDLVQKGREFYMVRVHNGVSEKINGTLKGSDFTFDSDSFSIYALVYEDKKAIDTGDTTNINLLLTLLILSGICGVTLMRKQKS